MLYPNILKRWNFRRVLIERKNCKQINFKRITIKKLKTVQGQIQLILDL
jgi:hypothetical protein